MKTLGFIGVGNMGAGMAARLLGAGYRLVVCDTNRAAVDKLCALGATRAGSPAELAEHEGLDGLVTMLPSDSAVRETYLGPRGLLSIPSGRLRPSLLIDSSTVSRGVPIELAEAAAEVLLHPNSAAASGRPTACVLDAPVSGGVRGAADGTLTFMVGGEVGAVTAAGPVFEAMGRRVVHCGVTGTGQSTKVCNNAALAIEMAGVAEALALGVKLGLDPRALSAVFNSSTAKCWSSEVNNPVAGVVEGAPASRDYANGFGASLMCKDLGLALAAAEGAGAGVPMARAARELYQRLSDEAGPTVDFSGVYRHIYGGGDAPPGEV